MSGHTDDDIEQRIDMAKVVIEKYVKHIQDKDLEAAGAYTKSIVGQLDGFKAFDDIYDPVRLNDNLELSDDATDNSYDNPSSIVALGEDIKFIIQMDVYVTENLAIGKQNLAIFLAAVEIESEINLFQYP